jgi:hypothetical protein
MDDCIRIDDLRKHLENAKDRLSQEKIEILKLHPLSDGFNREEYAFNYMRAERFGLRAINRRLAEIAWLPMQLDPRTEVLSESRESMKRWLTSALAVKPDSHHFGNDFIHALARCSIEGGNNNPAFFKLSNRISNLFRDLSCLIGLIYYCTWLSENHIEAVGLTNPDDLNHTAEEIAELIQSPEIYRHIRAREQDDEKKKAKSSAKHRLIAESDSAAGNARGLKEKKSRPALHVIDNPNFIDAFIPDPLPV